MQIWVEASINFDISFILYFDNYTSKHIAFFTLNRDKWLLHWHFSKTKFLSHPLPFIFEINDIQPDRKVWIHVKKFKYYL